VGCGAALRNGVRARRFARIGFPAYVRGRAPGRHWNSMVTKSDRLSQFTTDREAPDGTLVEALCQDHVGTYVLPFPCRRDGATWYNDLTSAALDCDVIGWRELQGITRARF
jgi:hypothetical protein